MDKGTAVESTSKLEVRCVRRRSCCVFGGTCPEFDGNCPEHNHLPFRQHNARELATQRFISLKKSGYLLPNHALKISKYELSTDSSGKKSADFETNGSLWVRVRESMEDEDLLLMHLKLAGGLYSGSLVHPAASSLHICIHTAPTFNHHS